MGSFVPSLPVIGRIPILPNLPPWLAFTQGSVYHVEPSTGNDGRDGRTVPGALKTLGGAAGLKSRMVANQNDIGLIYGQGNASALCTDYQSATLTWDKDFTHLIGVHSGSLFSPRARISLISTYNTASNLMTISANGCSFIGLQFFEGVAHANPTGCLQVTGSRNHFYRCHIAGIGDPTNDIAGAYSLFLNGASENVFEECIIGLGTVAAGTAANREIEMAGTSSRNYFKNCLITRRINHTTNHPLVHTTGATAIDDITLFENCQFVSWSVNKAVAQTGVFAFGTALTSGEIILKNCVANSGIDGQQVKWDGADSDFLTVFASAKTPADTAGTELMV